MRSVILNICGSKLQKLFLQGTTASLSYDKINSPADITTGLSCWQALRLKWTRPSVTDSLRQTPTASCDTPAPARRQIKRFITGSASHPVTCFDIDSWAAPNTTTPTVSWPITYMTSWVLHERKTSIVEDLNLCNTLALSVSPLVNHPSFRGGHPWK
jgi:hypothetical protein